MSDYAFTYDEEILTLLRDIRDPLIEAREELVTVNNSLFEIVTILYDAFGKMVEHLNDVATNIDELGNDLIDNLVVTTTAESGSKETKGGTSTLDKIANRFKTIFNIFNAFSPLIDVLAEPFEMLVEVFVAQFYPIVVALLPFLYGVVNALIGLMTYLTPIITAIADWISKNVTLNNLIIYATQLWQWLVNVFTPLVTLVKSLWEAFKGIYEALKNNDLSSIKGFVKDIIDAIVRYSQEVIYQYKDAIMGLGRQVLEWWMGGAQPQKNASEDVVWYNPFTWFNTGGSGSSNQGEGSR